MRTLKPLIIAIIAIFFLQTVITPTTVDAAGKLPKGSSIGTTSVAGKTDAEVKAAIDTEIATWQAGEDIVISGDEESYRIPRTIVNFDVQTSINNLNNKTKRTVNSFFLKPKNQNVELEVSLNTSHEVYQTLSTIDYIDTDATLAPIITFAKNFQAGDLEIIYVEGGKKPVEIVAESKLELPELSSVTLKYILDTLDGYTIEGKGAFDLVEVLDLPKNMQDSPEELSFIATALYHVFLKTNIEFADRYSQPSIPEYTEAGLDVYVDVVQDKQFVTYNPNEFAYQITMKVKDGELHTTLLSSLRDETYAYVAENEREIEARTLFRYEKEFKAGQTKVIQEGEDGSSVEIYRTISIDGEEIEKTLISTDVYLPVPEIMLISPDTKVDAGDVIGGGGNDGDDALVVNPPDIDLPGSLGSPGAPGGSSLSADIRDLLTNMEGRISSLEGTVERLEGELNDEIEARRNAIYELEVKINKFDDQIDELQAKRDDSKAFLTALSNTLDKYPDIKNNGRLSQAFKDIGDAIVLPESEYEKANQMIDAAVNLIQETLEEELAAEFFIELLDEYRKLLENGRFSPEIPKVSAVMVQNIDYTYLKELETTSGEINKRIAEIDAEIKKTKDNKKIAKLTEEGQEKLVEQEEVQANILAETDRLNELIREQEEQMERELSTTIRKYNAIEDEYKEAQARLDALAEDNATLPDLNADDYTLLIEQLIELSSLNEETDKSEYDTLRTAVKTQLHEVFGNLNNDVGVDFLESVNGGSIIGNQGGTLENYDFVNKSIPSWIKKRLAVTP